ncbi:MAG: hypothetical protein ACI4WS_01555 [Oscillospiraceae bacterium]
MNKNAKVFLRNAILLTAVTVLIILLMEQWGVAQVIIAVLLALLSAGQWGLYLYMKKH